MPFDCMNKGVTLGASRRSYSHKYNCEIFTDETSAPTDIEKLIYDNAVQKRDSDFIANMKNEIKEKIENNETLFIKNPKDITFTDLENIAIIKVLAHELNYNLEGLLCKDDVMECAFKPAENLKKDKIKTVSALEKALFNYYIEAEPRYDYYDTGYYRYASDMVPTHAQWEIDNARLKGNGMSNITIDTNSERYPIEVSYAASCIVEAPLKSTIEMNYNSDQKHTLTIYNDGKEKYEQDKLNRMSLPNRVLHKLSQRFGFNNKEEHELAK